MNRIRLTLTAVAAVAAATVLAGCGTPSTSSTAPASPAASSSPASAPVPRSSQATSSSTPALPGVPAGAPVVVKAAAKVFTTWDQPQLDYDTWWSQLKPLLSMAGQQAYAGTDPANIPALKITGEYRLDPVAPDDPDTTAMVHVTTNRGKFGLFMEHEPGSSNWKMLQIVFPAGIH